MAFELHASSRASSRTGRSPSCPEIACADSGACRGAASAPLRLTFPTHLRRRILPGSADPGPGSSGNSLVAFLPAFPIVWMEGQALRLSPVPVCTSARVPRMANGSDREVRSDAEASFTPRTDHHEFSQRKSPPGCIPFRGATPYRTSIQGRPQQWLPPLPIPFGVELAMWVGAAGRCANGGLRRARARHRGGWSGLWPIAQARAA